MLKIVEKTVPAILELSPKEWSEKIKTYISARQTRKSADALSRTTDKILKPIKAEILCRLGDAEKALCGDMVLEIKHSAPVPASVTLPDGNRIAWSTVHSITVGNHVFPASECQLYGGRAGNTDLEISNR